MCHNEKGHVIVSQLCQEFEAGECMFIAVLKFAKKLLDMEKAFAFLDIRLKILPENEREEFCSNLGKFFEYFDAFLNEKYTHFAQSSKDLNTVIQDLPKDNKVPKYLHHIQESFMAAVEGHAFAKNEAKNDRDFAFETVKCFAREGFMHEEKQIRDIIENQ